MAPLPQLSFGRRLATRVVLLLFGWLVSVEGAERLQRLHRPVVFAFNHNNSLETVVVAAVLAALRAGRLVSFLVDWMFVHLPGVGWLVRLCDPVAVYTKPARFSVMEATRLAHRRRSPVDAAAIHLDQGKDIGIFPESRRNPNPWLLERGRPGIGRLVLATGAEVIPVGLCFPAGRRRGRAPALGKLEVRIGEPLSFRLERLSLLAERDPRGELPPGAARAFSQTVADRVMEAIAPLARKTYPWPTGLAGAAVSTLPDEESS